MLDCLVLLFQTEIVTRLPKILLQLEMRFCGAAMIGFVPVSPDLSSGESEEEERICGMSGEKVRLEKNFIFPLHAHFFWFIFVTVVCAKPLKHNNNCSFLKIILRVLLSLFRRLSHLKLLTRLNC